MIAELTQIFLARNSPSYIAKFLQNIFEKFSMKNFWYGWNSAELDKKYIFYFKVNNTKLLAFFLHFLHISCIGNPRTLWLIDMRSIRHSVLTQIHSQCGKARVASQNPEWHSTTRPSRFPKKNLSSHASSINSPYMST